MWLVIIKVFLGSCRCKNWWRQPAHLSILQYRTGVTFEHLPTAQWGFSFLLFLKWFLWWNIESSEGPGTESANSCAPVSWGASQMHGSTQTSCSQHYLLEARPGPDLLSLTSRPDHDLVVHLPSPIVGIVLFHFVHFMFFQRTYSDIKKAFCPLSLPRSVGFSLSHHINHPEKLNT